MKKTFGTILLLLGIFAVLASGMHLIGAGENFRLMGVELTAMSGSSPWPFLFSLLILGFGIWLLVISRKRV